MEWCSAGIPEKESRLGEAGLRLGTVNGRTRVRPWSRGPLQAQPSSQGFAGVREMGSRRPWKLEWERSQAEHESGATGEAAEDSQTRRHQSQGSACVVLSLGP